MSLNTNAQLPIELVAVHAVDVTVVTATVDPGLLDLVPPTHRGGARVPLIETPAHRDGRYWNQPDRPLAAESRLGGPNERLMVKVEATRNRTPAGGPAHQRPQVLRLRQLLRGHLRRELREAWRDARRTALQILIKVATTGILAVLLVGAAIKLKV